MKLLHAFVAHRRRSKRLQLAPAVCARFAKKLLQSAARWRVLELANLTRKALDANEQVNEKARAAGAREVNKYTCTPLIDFRWNA